MRAGADVRAAEQRDERTPLRELLAADADGAGLDLDAIFDYAPFVRYADEIVGRLDSIAPIAPIAAEAAAEAAAVGAGAPGPGAAQP